MRVLLFLLLACAACAQNGASITVGDEVVFSGGPSQPPKSIQTGFQLEVNSIRGGGGGDAGPRKGKKGKGQGDASATLGAGTGSAGSGSAGTGSAGTGNVPADLVPPTIPADPALADKAPEEPAVPDLAKLSTDDLTAALGDRATARRQAAVTALGTHVAAGERAVVKSALESALSDSEPVVVRRAADALAQLGDASAAPGLFKLVYDRDDGVAVASIKAVASLGYKPAIPELTKLGGRDLGPVGRAAREAVAELSRPPRSLPIDPKTQPAPKVP